MSGKVIQLVGEKQREYARQLLDAVKLNPQEPTEIVFRRHVKKRSDPQRSLFWIWVRAFKHFIEDSIGRIESEQGLHDMLCAKFLPVVQYEVLGKTITRQITTSDLGSTKRVMFNDTELPSMADLLEWMDRYFVEEYGFYAPTPGSDL
jgi:hypothetical protein